MLKRSLLVVAFCIVVVVGLAALEQVDQWWTRPVTTVLGIVAALALVGSLVPGEGEVPADRLAATPRVVVRIETVGEQGAQVVEAVRDATGLAMAPVRAELEQVPARFVVRSVEDAEALCAALERRGAVAVVEPTDGRAGFGV